MLVDSHCHLDASEFDRDRDAVIARAQAAGVMQQLLPAVSAAGWPKLRDICASTDGLFPAYGLHPMYLQDHRDEHLAELDDWINREHPCAIGECGLDFFVDGLDPRAQQHFFDGQLELARTHALPLSVHARRSVDAVIASIKRIGSLCGVVHSFSGSAEQARQLAQLGFLIGLGGPVTYERANRLRRLAASVPVESLFLETDAPDQPDAGIRGQRNEPARLANVLQVVADLRGETPAAIAAATSTNARRLFRLPA
jgi:TatD DNase family protein